MKKKKVIKKKAKKKRQYLKDYKRPTPHSENHVTSLLWHKILPKQMGERLAECATQRQCSGAWLIEEIINQWLREHEDEWRKSIRPGGTITSVIANVTVRKPLAPSTIVHQREPNTTANDAQTKSAKGIKNEVSGNVGAHDQGEPRRPETGQSDPL